MIIIYWLHNQYHLDIVVEPTPPPAHAPLISVCIPARNEERNIRTCVEAMLAQDYPNFEVIVLDDRSSDATPSILADIASRDSRLHTNQRIRPTERLGRKTSCIIPGLSLCARRMALLCGCRYLRHLASALSSCYAKAIETNADMFTIMTFQIIGIILGKSCHAARHDRPLRWVLAAQGQ